MSLAWIVYILTALAVVAVALTRLRLGGGRAAGRFRVSTALLNTHTGAGSLAIVIWTVFLFTGIGAERGGHATIGIVGLTFFWITTIAGLMILARWMPTRGKHSSSTVRDGWSQGPWLSILAHVGMLIGVCVLTWAYLISAV